MSDKKKTNLKQVLKYILRIYLKEKKIFIALLVFAVLAFSGGLVLPIFFKEIINVLADFDGNKEKAAAQIFDIFSFVVVTYILLWIFWRLVDFSLMKFLRRVISRVSLMSFENIQNRSHDFFVNNFVGSVLKKANRFMTSVERLSEIFIFDVLSFVVSVGFIFTVLFFEHFFIGLIYSSWAILFGILVYFLYKKKIPIELAEAEEDSKVSGEFADAITNNFNISLFGTLKREYNRFSGAVGSWMDSFERNFWWDIVIFGIQTFLLFFLEISAFVVTFFLWKNNSIEIGTFVLLISYREVLFHRFMRLGHIFKNIYRHLTDSSEMVEILDTPIQVQDVEGAKDLKVPYGKIQFQNVKFGYDNGVNIFEDFSLDIEPGEVIALVGASGSGKSSIVKLLLRLYDIQGGRILIDDQDISKVTQNSLRDNISFIPQEPILFHRPLSENIAYVKPDVDMETIRYYSKMAYADNFISSLKDGYNTYVGERGVKLSGGERQRVALARAFLKNAPIFVFDEATSSLDSEAEKYIQEALSYMMEQKTGIIIAHRLSTVLKADRIVVMDQGKVVEQGSHNELLEKEDGFYKKLWDIQSGGFIG